MDILNSKEQLYVVPAAEGMQTWDDNKKKEYVGLFNERTNSSVYILAHTAREVAERARLRKFLGGHHYEELRTNTNLFTRGDLVYRCNGNKQNPNVLVYEQLGRSIDDLDSVVKERAEELLSSLPSLNKAMLILDADTYQKMIRRDKLKANAQALLDAFKDVSEDIKLSDVDQSMSISDFRKYLKSLESKRREMLDKLNDYTSEGQSLERQIDKMLARGIPGISEEIYAVCIDIYEKCKALTQLNRRVEEQVLYGDSDAALSLLRHFEKDEGTLRDDIKTRFQNGLESLKLATTKPRKKKLNKKG